jgi:hypothetical protein
MTRDSLLALEGKLKEAKGPSRELDALIDCVRLGGKWKIEPSIPGMVVDRGCEPPIQTRHLAEPVTFSLDAAVAFAEAMLKGWGWAINDGCCASVWKETALDCAGDTWPEKQGDPMPATPALALCLAVVRALIAKETT